MELIPTFLLLAEELNISRSAKKLGISQPALTRQLQTLEESFGTQLFVRQSRGLALTPTGRALRKEILPGYEALRAALAKVQNTRADLSGTLSFGCFSEIGTNLIVPALCEFAKKNPAVTFDVRYLSEAEIISGVADGQLHLGLTNHAPSNEALRCYKLLDERVALVTSATNPELEKNPQPRFAGYRNNDRLLLTFIKSHGGLWAGKTPEIVMSVNSHPAMINAITHLGLYAALPHHSIGSALKSGRIKIASSKQVSNKVHLIIPDSDFTERKAIEVVKFLRQKFKSLEGENG